MMKKFGTFGVLLLLSIIMYRSHAQQPESVPISNEDSSKRELFEQQEVELFKKLFTRRRSEHNEAVKRIQKIESYEKRYKMLSVLVENVYNVIDANRQFLEKGKFDPNVLFQENPEVKDALSGILENTALFGDVVLHFPDIMQRILKHQSTWHSLMKWSFSFVSQMRHLLDKSTFTRLHLAEQELNFIPRNSDYVNPYWTNPSEDTNKKAASKKEKRKKEPRITRIEL